MPHEVIVFQPSPRGGYNVEEIAAAMAEEADRVEEARGEVVSERTLIVGGPSTLAEALFVVVNIPVDEFIEAVKVIRFGHDI